MHTGPTSHAHAPPPDGCASGTAVFVAPLLGGPAAGRCDLPPRHQTRGVWRVSRETRNVMVKRVCACVVVGTMKSLWAPASMGGDGGEVQATGDSLHGHRLTDHVSELLRGTQTREEGVHARWQAAGACCTQADAGAYRLSCSGPTVGQLRVFCHPCTPPPSGWVPESWRMGPSGGMGCRLTARHPSLAPHSS
jgi:hypothetical protein